MVELAKIITIGDMSGSSFMFSEREMLAFSVTLSVDSPPEETIESYLKLPKRWGVLSEEHPQKIFL